MKLVPDRSAAAWLLAASTPLFFFACKSSPEVLGGDATEGDGDFGDGDGMGGESTMQDISVGGAGVFGSGGSAATATGGGAAVEIPCVGETCTAGQRCEPEGCIDNTCDDLDCGDGEGCEAHAEGGSYCRDLSCSADVNCNADEHCSAGLCTGDVCTEGVTSCDLMSNALQQCSATGDELRETTCDTESYFASTCDDSGADAGCTCEDDWDCPAYMECEQGACTGTGVAPTCTLEPAPFSDTLPAEEIHWGGDAYDNDDAHDGVGDPVAWADSSEVLGTPLVANLDDDNGDGAINELDFPEIIFISYPGTSWNTNGTIRAIHGGGPNKGKEFFTRCGTDLWQEGDALPVGNCGSSGDSNPGSTPAVADLDYDGIPEIIVPDENGTNTMSILSNTGELILTVDTAPWNLSGSPAETVSVANLDYDGHAELILGKYIFVLGDDTDGNLIHTHTLVGTGGSSEGSHNSGGLDGIMSCVADIHGSDGQEIVVGTSLFALPSPLPDCVGDACTNGSLSLDLVWDAMDNSINSVPPSEDDGYCAVANVWGPDFNAAPSPTNHPDTDRTPEVVLIADGRLIILAGATGELIYDEDLGGGSQGGAPNVDDFDGDGFMEVASALSAKYTVVDLQQETTACPAWPTTIGRDSLAVNPNTARAPGGSCSVDGDCANGAFCTEAGECSCLHNGWSRGSDDSSSQETSSSVFDFNGDGAAEVIYNDECEIRVYDGIDGDVYFLQVSRSRTSIENPVIADVDNDGNAEIVTVANTEQTNRCDDDSSGVAAGPNGIRVWGDPTDTWVSARRIWNQQSYHVTNVTESGRIPLHPPESWGSFGGRTYNTYRSQPRSFGVAPDLAVSGVNVSSPDATCGTLSSIIDVGFQLENLGDLRVGPGVELSFVGIWGAEEEPLEDADGEIKYVVGVSLEPKAVLLDSVQFDIADHPGRTTLPDTVRVMADTGGEADSLIGAERECNEDNNEADAAVDGGETRPDLAVTVADVALNCNSGAGTVEVEVENVGSALATDVELSIYAGDPSQGGQFLGRVEIESGLAAGASEDLTLNFTSLSASGAHVWVVADPENVIAECNETNNRDPSDNRAPTCVNVVR